MDGREMTNKTIPTQQYLHETFNYNPDTGLFFRKRKISNITKIDKPLLAGAKSGRISIHINGKIYRAHKLAWLYVYGEWPQEIDHINNDGTDNRICNLRKATRSENTCNRRTQVNNKSGHKGVSWCKSKNKWDARIGVENKIITLGRFEKIEDAIAAVNNARQKHHGNFANYL
jgi:hypothetical protein